MAGKERRELLLQDGSSDKFWNIELDGSSHTVQYGRVGTNGRTQTKEFDDESEAKESYDKLVESKLKKGYTDDSGSDGTTAAGGKKKAVAKKAKPAKKKAETAEEPVEEEVAVEAAEVETTADLRVTHEIDLSPEDWHRAPYRGRVQLERGEPAPYDKDDCVKRLAQVKKDRGSWYPNWSTLELSPTLSREEAHFWVVATTEKDRETKTTMKDYAKKMAGVKKINGQLDVATAAKLAKRYAGYSDVTTIGFANLFTADEYLDLVDTVYNQPDSWDRTGNLTLLLRGFEKYVLPYLNDKQVESLRKRVGKGWTSKGKPASHTDHYPWQYYIAATLGMHDKVYEVVSNWEDDRYKDEPWSQEYQLPVEIVRGLESAELIASEWRRLKLSVMSGEDVKTLLACTEYIALDYLADCIIAQSQKHRVADALQAFTLVRAPEAAEPMLRCRMDSKMPGIARGWLDTYVGNAVAGLIKTAGGRGKLADAAVEYLRDVKRMGHESVIADCLEKATNSEAAAKVQADVIDYTVKVYSPLDAKSTPKWLTKELADLGKLKKKSLPDWVQPALLPPLTVGDHRLSDEQVGIVLQVLAATPVSQKHPLLVALRENVSSHSRDAFAWKLFSMWQETGYDTKQKWAMASIGHLGEDSCALQLTPLVRVWPGESQHPRAVLGLECLRAIGSNTALMQLSGIAQKLKYKGLKSKAELFVSEIAKERNMTRDELEDRIVPDCGLDEQGRREFSFGPRTFSFVLGGDLKPSVRDENGKVRPNLPKPGVKDDEEVANAALAEWKLVKKQIKDVATLQAGRLEQAMITGRRWNLADFESLLVRHPLQTHLVQKLIWGAFDKNGERIAAFRVTEERDYADTEDDTLDLGKAETVGVVHPLEMSEQERARWGEVMSDYEIVAPFPQLGRTVYALESGEGKTDDLKRYCGLKLYAPTMVFTLEKLGWTRGVAMDAGGFDEHSKQFRSADVTAVVMYDGCVGMGYIDPEEMLTTSSIHFCAGMRPASGYGYGSKKRLKLEKVPPIVISEVVADLEVLKSKSK